MRKETVREEEAYKSYGSPEHLCMPGEECGSPTLRLRESCYPLLPKDIKTIRVIRVDDCVSCYLETSLAGSEFN